MKATKREQNLDDLLNNTGIRMWLREHVPLIDRLEGVDFLKNLHLYSFEADDQGIFVQYRCEADINCRPMRQHLIDANVAKVYDFFDVAKWDTSYPPMDIIRFRGLRGELLLLLSVSYPRKIR